jgi:predicted nucleic acid-binding protein
MIILDTNVISEAMKQRPDQAVRNWLNSQVEATLYLSSVTLAELLLGIGSLPKGKRKNQLAQGLDDLLSMFKDKILPFDTEAAGRYAQLAVIAKKAGRAFPIPDAYIAAIAAARGFIVASRDTGPYEAVGVKVINPWEG